MPVHLYIIAHRSAGGFASPVKVGISQNPEGRLREIQTSNPYPLRIMWTFEFDRRDEARLHEQRFHREFAADRMRGEWFRVEPTHAISLLCLAIRRSVRGDKTRLRHSGVLMAEEQFPARLSSLVGAR